MEFIYFSVAIIATTVGALTGVGGGVIIKPVLDLIGNFPASNISLLSSFTVFSMSIVSIGRQVFYKTYIDKKVAIILGVGSVVGGYLGEKILGLFINFLNNDSLVKITQNSIMVVLLLLVLFNIKSTNKGLSKEKTKDKDFKYMIILGIILGGIGTFLGIGGGPINVAALTLFFAMSAKEATVYSIITISFSQFSKILTVAFTTGFQAYNLSMLPFMIIGGIAGGAIGSRINKKSKDTFVIKSFNIMIAIILAINIVNIITILTD